ncbi:hypothetical protein P4N68_03580 [Corynebacterium felinum]|uniref:Uncharacterized protein n=1 Tax=Corynebacterium felinum TaxID=131318 RepID=A0ABU2B6A8_9CORY|nr:hypothetical protein [Corynebacterium felinum]MDF5820164.1 hypothetical protein [Corynebacterium felinum]MDR7353916.1 hypothetical protein [Corynebacterium felinum]
MTLSTLVHNLSHTEPEVRSLAVYTLLKEHSTQLSLEQLLSLQPHVVDAYDHYLLTMKTAKQDDKRSTAQEIARELSRLSTALSLITCDYPQFLRSQKMQVITEWYAGDTESSTKRKEFLTSLDPHAFDADDDLLGTLDSADAAQASASAEAPAVSDKAEGAQTATAELEPLAPVVEPIAPAAVVSETCANALATHFGAEAFAQGKRIDNFAGDFSAFFAPLVNAPAEQVQRWVQQLSAHLSCELERNGRVLSTEMIALDKVLADTLFFESSPSHARSYTNALDSWHGVLATLDADQISLLSLHNSYYALRKFATLPFPGAVHWASARAKLRLLEERARSLKDIQTASRAAVIAVNWAKVVSPAVMEEEAQRTCDFLLDLHTQGHLEVQTETIWAIRTYADLKKRAGNNALAWDLLWSIPTRFHFDALSQEGKVGFIFSRIELAGLANIAQQYGMQNELLREAALYYRSCGMHKESENLVQRYNLKL